MDLIEHALPSSSSSVMEIGSGDLDTSACRNTLQRRDFRSRTRPYIAEFFGTFLMVLIGVGSVCSAVLTGALMGLWQVAVVWGFGVAISIYATADISGAHLNPAVTFTMALFHRYTAFRWRDVGPYILAQVAGATTAGAVLYGVWAPVIAHFETQHGIVRGQPGSERSAMVMGEYFPNPGAFSPSDTVTQAALDLLVIPARAILVEALGTGILMCVIFCLTDRCNKITPAGFAPFFIGFTVAVLIAIFAPLTQAGWNPARDFGPRLVAAMAGWGSVAIPGPRNGFWVYIVGPFIGAPLGGALYFGTLRRHQRECQPHEKCE
ncbi:hypothetical protein RI367_007264 [Sorochytrium milnesiophthora]